MADLPKPRPVLIPPLHDPEGKLELVREPKPRDQRRNAEHPHCDEHFIFTPHCAACLEAERLQPATAYAEPVTMPVPPVQHKAVPSSRSFGFTDSITPEVMSELRARHPLLSNTDIDDISSGIVDILRDL